MSAELAASMQAKKRLFNWDSGKWVHSISGTIFHSPGHKRSAEVGHLNVCDLKIRIHKHLKLRH